MTMGDLKELSESEVKNNKKLSSAATLVPFLFITNPYTIYMVP